MHVRALGVMPAGRSMAAVGGARQRRTSPAAVRWTASGAVAAPEFLQIRVAPRFVGRVSVGAPMPTRAMTADEVDANVRHFTEGMRGPRSRPVRQLVLSGLDGLDGLDALDTLGSRADGWRRQGIETIVLHIGATAAARVLGSSLGPAADRVVVTVASVNASVRAALAQLPMGELGLSVSLTDDVRQGLGSLVLDLTARSARSVTWVWPFPTNDTPPPPRATDVVSALSNAGALDLPGARLVHMPRCLDPRKGEPSAPRWRTRNRFYVDAGHQLGDALLFFPDLVELAKPDRCRFCREDLTCDGVAAPWLEQGRTGPLEPM